MRTGVLFTFLALLASLSSFSQKPFYKGYVVTIKGDTIKGSIKSKRHSYVIMEEESNKKLQLFKSDIREAKFARTHAFRKSVVGTNRSLFMNAKSQRKTYRNFYLWEIEYQSSRTVQGMVFVEEGTDYYIEYPDAIGEVVQVPAERRKRMKFFSECERLSEDIADRYAEEIEEIMNKYDRCLDK